MYPKNKEEKFTHEKWLNKVFTVDFFLFLGTKLESIDFPNIDVERVQIITPECYIFSLKKAILNMNFRFKEGDTVFICSRYEGIKKVKITGQVVYEGKPCYSLDKQIQISKNEYFVGSEEYVFEEGEFWSPNKTIEPCPEHLLFVVGDKMTSPISNLFGTTTGETFTQEMADSYS